MPEVPICVVCRKPIDKQNEDYVVVNKDKVRYDNEWLFAHADCQREAPEK